MNIRFESISINNFMSIGSADITFSNYMGYTLIRGINKNLEDNAASNGSGKSTIWEALIWNLTGQTLRGNKDVVRHGETKCSVTLTFYVDTNKYQIERTKADTSNLLIYINDENKSGKGIRDTEKLLSQYLPDLNSSLLNSTIILGQGLPDRFTNNTPSGRKEVLEKLSKSDFMIEDLKDRVTNRLNALNKKQRELEDDRLKLATTIDIHQTQQKNNINNLNCLQPIEELEIATQKYKDIIEKDLQEINEHNLIIADIDTKIHELEEKLFSVQAEKSDKILEMQTSILNDTELKALKEQKATLSAQMSQLQATIKKFKNVVDTCPTCGQKLPNVTKISTEAEEKELQNLTNTLSLVNKDILDKETTNTAFLNDLKSKYTDSISNLTVEKEKLISRKTEVSAKLQELNSQKHQSEQLLAAAEHNIAEYTSKKEALEKTINDTQILLQDYASQFDALTEDITSINNKVDIVNKFNTIIKRDFRGYLLTNIISYIDTKAKEYSEYIFGTRKISFVQDGNNISISYCNKEYEALSGGEKQKVDLIIQFAIRDMLCKYLNFGCNILVLDEITDNLDSIGCDKVIDFISNKLNIDCIYIISHRAESLSIPYDHELLIVKDASGVSSIE